MIAPLRLPTTETTPRMRRAHGFIATTLLDDEYDLGQLPKHISAWRSWLFVGWVLVATGWYFMSMLDWI